MRDPTIYAVVRVVINNRGSSLAAFENTLSNDRFFIVIFFYTCFKCCVGFYLGSKKDSVVLRITVNLTVINKGISAICIYGLIQNLYQTQGHQTPSQRDYYVHRIMRNT